MKFRALLFIGLTLLTVGGGLLYISFSIEHYYFMSVESNYDYVIGAGAVLDGLLILIQSYRFNTTVRLEIRVYNGVIWGWFPYRCSNETTYGYPPPIKDRLYNYGVDKVSITTSFINETSYVVLFVEVVNPTSIVPYVIQNMTLRQIFETNQTVYINDTSEMTGNIKVANFDIETFKEMTFQGGIYSIVIGTIPTIAGTSKRRK